MPPTTLTELIPPPVGYTYFDGSKDLPFHPHATDYSPVNAWWLAEASLLAYEGQDDVSERLQQSGLDPTLGTDAWVTSGQQHGAQCVVITMGDFAIASFRGTRIVNFPNPIALFRLAGADTTDVRTDIDFAIPPGSDIHPGWASALDEVWEDVRSHLDEIGGADGRRAIWFAGHSLGAALATIAADRYGSDRVRGLYTFGSPRVGDATFARQFSVPCFRFVNNNDFVPHLPPEIDGYEHVRSGLRFIDSDGSISDDPDLIQRLESGAIGDVRAIVDAVRAFDPVTLAGHLFGRPVPHATDLAGALGVDVVPVAALADHAPINYATLVWNALVSHSS